MKKIEYYCDKCRKPWDLNYDPSAYTLDRVSLTGSPIMGDNRIPQTLHFCSSCFEKLWLALRDKE